MKLNGVKRLLAFRDRRRARVMERDQFRRAQKRERLPEDVEQEQQEDLQKRLAAGSAANKFPPW